ncbi:hypothetical protein [Mariniluteicoccus endophyticus]
MDLDMLMAGAPVIRRNDKNRGRITRQVRAGNLVAVLPGVFARAGAEEDPVIRAQAVCAYDPRAVVTGRSAAALHVTRGQWPSTLTIASSRRWQLSRSWLSVTQTAFPPDLVRRVPFPHCSPALAVLQVAGAEGPDFACRALFRRRVQPRELEEAAAALNGSWGVQTMRRIAREVRNNPWSMPERDLHVLPSRRTVTATTSWPPRAGRSCGSRPT